jgi:hypothetical protein
VQAAERKLWSLAPELVKAADNIDEARTLNQLGNALAVSSSSIVIVSSICSSSSSRSSSSRSCSESGKFNVNLVQKRDVHEVRLFIYSSFIIYCEYSTSCGK